MGRPDIVLFKSHSGSNAKLLTPLPLAADMDKVRRIGRTKQASAMLDPAEVYVEKLRAVRNSRAGQLSVVSRVCGSIETLMDKTENVATVNERLSEYNEMWNRFTDAHNAFMTVAKDDSEDQIDALRQYDRLDNGKVKKRSLIEPEGLSPWEYAPRAKSPRPGARLLLLN